MTSKYNDILICLRDNQIYNCVLIFLQFWIKLRAHTRKKYIQADTEAEFRGWIDSVMHEIKRLISEKEKCLHQTKKR